MSGIIRSTNIPIELSTTSPSDCTIPSSAFTCRVAPRVFRRVVVVVAADGVVVVGGARAGAHVLLVAGAHVLEPHLSHPFRQTRQIGDALQVLAVGVRVEQEVCLEYVQLLLGERRAHPLRFRSAAALRVGLCEKSRTALFYNAQLGKTFSLDSLNKLPAIYHPDNERFTSSSSLNFLGYLNPLAP